MKSNEELLAARPDIAKGVQEGKVTLKRFTSDPPHFKLSWNEIGGDKPVNLNSDEVWSYAAIRRAVFKAWNVVLDVMTARGWHDLLTLLSGRAEVVEERGASVGAEVLDILAGWCESRCLERWREHDLNTSALGKDGSYYFTLDAFESQSLFTRNSRFFYQRYLIPRPLLYQILRDAGAQSIVKAFRKGRKRRVWQIPVDFNEPPEEAQGALEPPEDEAEDILAKVGDDGR